MSAMTDFLSLPATAFAGHRIIASGRLADVALSTRAALERGQDVLVFDDDTGKVIDLDLRGTPAEIVERLGARGGRDNAGVQPMPAAALSSPQRGRGRPKLGVVAREVTLLPRQWDWLSSQPGGASQALRRLVDQARRIDGGRTARNAARERAYHFASIMAGDLPGFEEAMRALFAGDPARFEACMAEWPADIRNHAFRLSAATQENGADGRAQE